MLTPALLALYNEAVAAHPIAKKEAEAEALAAIAQHFDDVDKGIHKLINALERKDKVAISETFRDRDLFMSDTFSKFLDACEAAISEAAAEEIAQPVAEPNGPAQAPLQGDPLLVLPPVEGLHPSDTESGQGDQTSPQSPVIVLGDHPEG